MLNQIQTETIYLAYDCINIQSIRFNKELQLNKNNINNNERNNVNDILK